MRRFLCSSARDSPDKIRNYKVDKRAIVALVERKGSVRSFHDAYADVRRL